MVRSIDHLIHQNISETAAFGLVDRKWSRCKRESEQMKVELKPNFKGWESPRKTNQTNKQVQQKIPKQRNGGDDAFQVKTLFK